MQIDEAVEARECYDLLTAVCSEGVLPLAAAYRRMRELLEHLCQAKAQDSSFLQMTEWWSKTVCTLSAWHPTTS